MVAYSFYPRFIEPIRQGMKTQTIRAVGLRRHARPGELLQLYSGMRTAHCSRILPDTPCLDVMWCEISFAYGPEPPIDRIVVASLPVRNLDAFAIRDGFVDIEDMAAFWHAKHPKAIKTGFRGLLIEWARPAETMQVAA